MFEVLSETFGKDRGYIFNSFEVDFGKIRVVFDESCSIFY